MGIENKCLIYITGTVWTRHKGTPKPETVQSQRISSQKNPQPQAPQTEIEEDVKRIGGEMLYSVQTGSDYHLTSTEIRSTNYLV